MALHFAQDLANAHASDAASLPIVPVLF